MAARLILHGPRPRPTRLLFYGPRRHTAVTIPSPEDTRRVRIRIIRHLVTPIICTMSWPENAPASATAGVGKKARGASRAAATACAAKKADPHDAVAMRDVKPKMETGSTAVKSEKNGATGDVKKEEECESPVKKEEEMEDVVKKEEDETEVVIRKEE